ncbi:MAG: MBL fold metallo-hydrolase [Deltaproteobacteria bacterium]|nr:MBL fold metallo-hydrolase [Deltaproteobacteria bacterium]
MYRIEAAMDQPMVPGNGRFDPIRGILSRHAPSTTQRFEQEFAESGAPVGASSMRVASHLISYPDRLMIVDATFPATGAEIFPGTLSDISRHEGRSFADRPLDVLYTHCHFDHSGGRDAVEELAGDVRTIAHPSTQALFEQSSKREMFFVTKGHFFRDCGIREDVETLLLSLRELYVEAAGGEMPEESPRNPFGSASDAPLRVDLAIEPGGDAQPLLDGRVEALCFEGHVPGHLCVRVAGSHLITGDMWLPATTSIVKPPGLVSTIVCRTRATKPFFRTRSAWRCATWRSSKNAFSSCTPFSRSMAASPCACWTSLGGASRAFRSGSSSRASIGYSWHTTKQPPTCTIWWRSVIWRRSSPSATSGGATAR